MGGENGLNKPSKVKCIFHICPIKRLLFVTTLIFSNVMWSPIDNYFTFLKNWLTSISSTIDICVICKNGFLNVIFYDCKISKACISPCKPWIQGWSACPHPHNMQWKVCNLIPKFPWKKYEVRNYTKINKNVKLHCEIRSMAN